jgi:hypothetical protein
MKVTIFRTIKENDNVNNTNINMQQNNKGEKAKGGLVLCSFSEFCFVVGFFY